MPIFANILQPLIDFFEEILKFFHDQVGFSWGWSIVAMTVVVRAAMLPLAIRQFKSMRALQRLSPEIKKLQEKYKDNRERLNQEMMKFYQQHKVNPFGACLPLLFQLPVFISLFYMLRKDLRYDICPQINPPTVPDPVPCGSIPDAQFLGIPDITDKATGTTLIILIVLYVGSQLVSSLVMSMPTADRNQRLIMLALPFVFVPFVIGFPAGLLVYWITTNIWTLLQQFTIRETLGRKWDHQFEAQAAAVAAASAGGGRSPTDAASGDGNGAGGRKGGGLFGALAARAQQASESAAEQKAAKGTSAGGAKAKAPTQEGGGARASSPPPPPPRKKKKRSGRRR